MARPVLLSNAFALIDTATGNRFNQFVASWEGKFFITNPSVVGGVVKFRVVDRAVVQAYVQQNILTGGTAEERLQILSKIATYDELATIRDNSNFNYLKTDYEFETANLNDAMKQSSPYAEPFVLLAPSTTVATVKQLLGLSTTTIVTGTGTGTGTVATVTTTNPQAKSILNTFDKITDTTNGIFGGVKAAYDADPWGTALIGLVVVEGGTQLITGKTMIIGKIFDKPTILLGGKAKGGKKRRKG